MKKLVLILFAFIIGLSAQVNDDPPPPPSKHMIDKFEQLEKIKIIELLNLDEEKTLKFFARRNESREELRKINIELHKLFEKVSEIYKNEETIGDETAQKYIDQIQAMERKHHTEREKFISSLNDLLTKEQILKYIVFENRFRDEVRKKFFKHREKK